VAASMSEGGVALQLRRKEWREYYRILYLNNRERINEISGAKKGKFILRRERPMRAE